MIEKERAVAQHPQIGDAAENAPAIRLRQVFLLEDAAEGRLVFRIDGRCASAIST